MNFKCNQRENEDELAHHLVLNDENETINIIQISGFASETVYDALMEMKALSRATRCKKHVFHVSASPEPGEKVNNKKWEKIWSIYEKAQGITGQPFVEVEHIKNGRTHRHRAYSRINTAKGISIQLSHTKRKNERAARQIEIELGHRLIKGKHDRAVINQFNKEGLDTYAKLIKNNKRKPMPVAEYTEKELSESKRLNINLNKVRSTIYSAWNNSDCGCSFQKELAKSGFLIAQGKKTVVAITSDGNIYPILRSITAVQRKKREQALRKSDLTNRISRNFSDTHHVVKNFKMIIRDKLSWSIPNISVLADIHETLKKPTKTMHATNTTTKPQRAPQPTEKRYSAKNNITPAGKWVIYRKSLLHAYYNKHLSEEVLNEIAPYWFIKRKSSEVLTLTNKKGKITDYGSQIISNCSDNELAAKVMVNLALAKGWKNINANGNDEFKIEVYKQCIEKNVSCNIDDNDIILWQKAMKQQTQRTGLSF